MSGIRLLLPLLFAALAVLFVTRAWLDHRQQSAKSTPARKAWLRIGLIFAAVTAYLLIFGHRIW
ncbi:MAG: hypothetical protein WB992_25170 [Bryobacteraceae bacterium]